MAREDKEKYIGTEPCFICGKECLPYGYTSNWKHLCSRMCSDEYDEKKKQPPQRAEG